MHILQHTFITQSYIYPAAYINFVLLSTVCMISSKFQVITHIRIVAPFLKGHVESSEG
jgi:hypothetical protein